jgi:TRAP-type C4-dicarboxylate transport system substrate-binding protein
MPTTRPGATAAGPLFATGGRTILGPVLTEAKPRRAISARPRVRQPICESDCLDNCAFHAIHAVVVEMEKAMLKALARCALFSFALLPAAAAAEPVQLKLSYYTSDREVIYRSAVKPFADGVNVAANGLIEIKVFTSGSLGKDYPGQMQLVLDGVADLAFVNPALTPDRFPDDAVVELPGLWNDVQEASLVYTRLLASGALRGYEDFFVVGALAGGPQSIQARPPIWSLKDLQGKKIRASNRTEGKVLDALGMSANVIPINQTAEAISRGAIDGATGPAVILVDFGIARVASHLYLMRLGFAPLAILMNRKKFDSLPKAGQDIIRGFSGEWLAARFAETFDTNNNLVMEQWKSDPMRTVVIPSRPDFDTAQATFRTVIKDWQAGNPRNLQLLTAVETEIAKLRSNR